MRTWVSCLVLFILGIVFSSGTGYCAVGIGIDFQEGGTTTDLAVPVKLKSGLVVSPHLGYSIVDGNSPAGAHWDIYNGDMVWYDWNERHFWIGLRMEKLLRQQGATPLLGVSGTVVLHDLDIPKSWGAKQKYTDFVFRFYLGGSVSLHEHFDLVGAWSPTVVLYGARSDDGPSSGNTWSSTTISLRWWLWGD